MSTGLDGLDLDPTLSSLLLSSLPNTNPDFTKPVAEASATGEIISESALYENDGLAESSEPYTSITYKSTTDSYGRTIYRFETKTSIPLVVVIFQNASKKLVSVNDRVLPLKTFLNLDHLEYMKDEVHEESNHDLQLRYYTPRINQGTVRANSDDGMSVYNFQDTTVPMIMMAMTIIQSKYNTF